MSDKLMTEEELNRIPPRWLSMTQAMEYAPGLGRRKIEDHLERREFRGKMDGGKWIIDRCSIDEYYSKDDAQFEREVQKRLAKLATVDLNPGTVRRKTKTASSSSAETGMEK